MLKITKKLTLNLKILRFFIIPTILVSTPFYNIQDVKAGLEFQWNQDSLYRRLKWFQKEDKKKFRNSIYFFLRPADRRSDLLKINLAIPKTFKSTLKNEKISFCKVRIGGFEISESSIAQEIMKSWSFIESFISDNDLAVEVYAVDGWSKDSNALKVNQDTYDTSSGKWLTEDANGNIAPPTSWQLFKKFSEMLSVLEDKSQDSCRFPSSTSLPR